MRRIANESKMKIKNNRRGSYILEAAIIVPIFVISLLMFIGIIPVISTCENIVFSTVDELRAEDAKSALRESGIELPAILKTRVHAENRNVTSFHITSYRYLYSNHGIDDLISVRSKAKFSIANPIGLMSDVNFGAEVVSRAFTGVRRSEEANSREEIADEDDSEIVYVFPQEGIRYHKSGCRYLKSNCVLATLSQKVKKKYHPCPLCDARTIPVGSQVFLFTAAGEAYHRGSCKSVDKYYIEMEKKDAVERGYTPCTICRPG